MNCPWHPNKRVVSSCKDCGADFCIECVRETDQTTLCPDCYRRKLNEIAREFTEPAEVKEERRSTPMSALPQEKAPQPAREASPFDDEGFQPAPATAERKKRGRKRSREKREKPAQMPPVVPHEEFLSQGPDEDFSKLAPETTRIGRRHRKLDGEVPPSGEAGVSPPADVVDEPHREDAVEKPRVEDTAIEPPAEDAVRPRPPQEGTPTAKIASPSEDRLLQDVMSKLLKPDAEAVPKTEVVTAEEKPQASIEPAPSVGSVPRKEERAERKRAAKASAREEKRAQRALAAMEGTRREKSAERWSFLAQPRCSEYTLIAVSWWRAAIFIVLMLLLGAVLWAVPNAYLVPKDQEYGIHAVLVGLILGLAFWWKAGKKHSTKLAVQAAITTFFALFIGEFLHWFLIITKYDAFRKIFFDFVSFRFLWENGADILKYTMEAMFPIAFLWLLLLPTMTAFIVGFGMPPIPEIFFQAWHALKGPMPEEKEASHGLEG